MIISRLREEQTRYLARNGISLVLAVEYLNLGIPDTANILWLVENKVSPSLTREYIECGVNPDAANVVSFFKRGISPKESIFEIMMNYSTKPHLWENKLPEGMKIVGQPDPNINCGSFALGESRWLSLDDTKLLLSKLTKKDTPSEGDVVVYFAHGEISHLGLITGNGKVRSKWGKGVVLEHWGLQVPRDYGGIREYRSKRQNLQLALL
jgi:hypothetical protein